MSLIAVQLAHVDRKTLRHCFFCFSILFFILFFCFLTFIIRVMLLCQLMALRLGPVDQKTFQSCFYSKRAVHLNTNMFKEHVMVDKDYYRASWD